MALEGLSEAVSSGSVVTQPEILGGYGAGDSVKGVMPDAVVFPESVEEVSRVALWARQAGMKLMPVSSEGPHRGAVVPSEGYVVADMSHMKTIVRADRRNRVALVEAGVTFDELDVALSKVGLRASAAQGQVGRRGIPRPDPHACAAGAVGPLRPAPLHRGGDGIGDGLSYRLLRRPRNARGAVGDRPGAEEPDGPLGL